MQLTIEIKSVYGVQRIYAVCNNAKLITKLKQSKTLNKEDISILRELGYTIETKQPTIQKGKKMSIFEKEKKYQKIDITSCLDIVDNSFKYDNVSSVVHLCKILKHQAEIGSDIQGYIYIKKNQ